MCGGEKTEIRCMMMRRNEAVLVNEGKNVYTINGNLNPLDMPG